MKNDLRQVVAATAFIFAAASFPTASFATGGNSNPNTPADVIHPNIHDKVGNGDGTNANPNGANANGGNVHGIGNVPGQNGDHPNNDGSNGFANELNTVHGGIGTVNGNVD
jgi:hypothetical protein